MMLDIFGEYRIVRYLKSNNTAHLTMKQFMNRSHYFSEIDAKQKALWQNATEYYSRKFGHVLLFNAMNNINDRYSL